MTAGKKSTVYHGGDVVLVPFPFSNLSSAKTRPAVVVSEPAFTQATGDITVAMITSVRRITPARLRAQRLEAGKPPCAFMGPRETGDTGSAIGTLRTGRNHQR